MKRTLAIFAMAALAGCSTGNDTVTPKELTQALKDADVGVVEVHEEDPKESIVPGDYQHQLIITLQEVAPKGGQFFICEDPEGCVKTKAYFDALAMLAGPHRYVSKSGHVVAQLNKDVSQETGDKIVAVLDNM